MNAMQMSGFMCMDGDKTAHINSSPLTRAWIQKIFMLIIIM